MRGGIPQNSQRQEGQRKQEATKDELYKSLTVTDEETLGSCQKMRCEGISKCRSERERENTDYNCGQDEGREYVLTSSTTGEKKEELRVSL